MFLVTLLCYLRMDKEASAMSNHFVATGLISFIIIRHICHSRPDSARDGTQNQAEKNSYGRRAALMLADMCAWLSWSEA